MSAHDPLTDLFVYGSLLFADVFRGVTHLQLDCEPALLAGFARYRVRGASYPAIVPEPGAETAGGVYRDLPAEAMEALDRFETAMYERRRVRVTLSDGRPRIVEAYVCTPAARHLLEPTPWNPDEFDAAARAALGGDPE